MQMQRSSEDYLLSIYVRPLTSIGRKGIVLIKLMRTLPYYLKMWLLTIIFLLCFFSQRTLSVENCDMEPECHVFEWQPWSICLGNCGIQSQTRHRHMCCDMSVFPHTAENCLKHCNKTSDFKLKDSQSCRICENGGTLETSSLMCTCGARHKGVCCQDTVTCSDNPCKHGTCSDHASSFVCTCEPGYKGIDCNTRKSCSERITCQNGGTCQDEPNGFQCQCSKKYTGEFCEKPLTCNDAPCQNGGSCTSDGSSFQCRCLSTRTGEVCEKVITCASIPCRHGTCTDSPTGFVCTCDSSYTGVRCDTGFHVKPSEKPESQELLLPTWFPYLESALLTLASLTGIMTMGCACLKCCRAVGVLKGDDDDDDDDDKTRVENGLNRFKQKSVISFNNSKLRRNGLNF